MSTTLDAAASVLFCKGWCILNVCDVCCCIERVAIRSTCWCLNQQIPNGCMFKCFDGHVFFFFWSEISHTDEKPTCVAINRNKFPFFFFFFLLFLSPSQSKNKCQNQAFRICQKSPLDLWPKKKTCWCHINIFLDKMMIYHSAKSALEKIFII